jgi:hypothetical protein
MTKAIEMPVTMRYAVKSLKLSVDQATTVQYESVQVSSVLYLLESLVFLVWRFGSGGTMHRLGPVAQNWKELISRHRSYYCTVL